MMAPGDIIYRETTLATDRPDAQHERVHQCEDGHVVNLCKPASPCNSIIDSAVTSDPDPASWFSRVEPGQVPWRQGARSTDSFSQPSFSQSVGSSSAGKGLNTVVGAHTCAVQ
jgi:hypothetical protein